MRLLPPAILDMRLPTAEGRRPHLWLPLFLLWPLLWAVELLVLVPALVVDALLWMVGRKYHHYTLLLVRLFGLLGETRGMIVRITNPETDIDFAIW